MPPVLLAPRHQFSAFTLPSVDQISELIHKVKTSSCQLEPIPTALVKATIPSFLPSLLPSFKTRTAPPALRSAALTSILERQHSKRSKVCPSKGLFPKAAKAFVKHPKLFCVKTFFQTKLTFMVTFVVRKKSAFTLMKKHKDEGKSGLNKTEKICTQVSSPGNSNVAFDHTKRSALIHCNLNQFNFTLEKNIFTVKYVGQLTDESSSLEWLNWAFFSLMSFLFVCSQEFYEMLSCESWKCSLSCSIFQSGLDCKTKKCASWSSVSRFYSQENVC